MVTEGATGDQDTRGHAGHVPREHDANGGDSGRPGTASSSWPVVMSAGVTVTLFTLFAMRHLLRYANADALLHSLMSTERLTFYYWGQGRLANVVPALASPIDDPWLNFRVQMFIFGASFFGLIAGFVLMHRRFAPGVDATAALSTAITIAITAAAAAAALKPQTGYTFVFEQQYAFSFLTYLFGVGLVVRRSSPAARLAGALAVVLALLVIPNTALLLPFAWPLSHGTTNRVRRLIEITAVTVLAMLISAIAGSRLYRGPSESHLYYDFSLPRALDGIPTAIEQIVNSVRILPTLVILTFAVLVLWIRRHRLPRPVLSILAGAVVLSLGWIAVFSANRWVELNGFGFRYYFPVYVTGMLVVAVACSQLVDMWLTSWTNSSADIDDRDMATTSARSLIRPGTVALVAAAGVWMAVAPMSVQSVRVLHDASPAAAAAAQFDLEFVVGDYWQVWPTVFLGLANGDQLFGVTYRSDPLVDDVRDAVASTLRRDQDVLILCAGESPDACLERFTSFTGREWQVSGTASETPLIVRLNPASP